MPDKLIEIGSAGGGGAILGAVLSFFGFKRRLDKIEDTMITEKTCDDRIKRIEQGLDTHTKALQFLAGKIDTMDNRVLDLIKGDGAKK